MEVSRRGFLKGSLAAGTLAAVGWGLDLTRRQVFAQAQTAEPQTEWHYGYCRMCMHDDCGVKFRVENGVVVKVEGNPDAPTNKGTLCPRGNSAIANLYNPYRVKAPMKRTNPKKGLNEDPGWVEISWDEAMEIVGSKLKEVRDKDPRRLFYMIGFGMMDYFTTFFPLFAIAYGTPNMVTCNGALCSVHYATALVQATFPVPIADYKYCDYHIAIGRTAGPNAGVANGPSRAVMEAIDRGMRMVVVDPRCSMEASKGEWVPIRPGNDLAFVLGLINTVLFEIKKLDVPFLKGRTNGPYLIDAQGNYIRGTSGKPQIWDLAQQKALDFDDPSLEDPVLEGGFSVNGAQVTTAFSLVKESMRTYTPEWAEEKSTVPAATIRRIAREFVDHARIGSTIEINGFTFPYRPVSVLASRGSIGHEDGSQLDLATKILNELVGALDVPGSSLGCNRGPVLQPDADGTVTPVREAAGEPFEYPPQHMDLVGYFPHRHATPHMAFQVMQDPKKYGLDYEIEAMLVAGGNPITSLTDPEMVADVIAKVPFTASIVYHLDEIAQLSDVILPEPAMLERLGTNTTDACFHGLNWDNHGMRITFLRNPVKPLYNTRHAHDIMLEILDRVGATPAINGVLNQMTMMGELTMVPLKPEYHLNPDKRYTIEEIWDRAFKSMYGPDKGIDYLKEHGFILNRDPEETCYNYYYFPGSETRYQLYFHTMKVAGERYLANLRQKGAQVPGWSYQELSDRYEPTVTWRQTKLMKGPKEYDLLAINWKIPQSMFRLGATDQIPWLVDWARKYDPYYDVACMNAATAAARGLADGDRVWVEAPTGKLQATLRTSELFHPDALGIAGANGRLVETAGKKGSKLLHFNRLLSGAAGTFDPINGGVEGTVRVKVYKA